MIGAIASTVTTVVTTVQALRSLAPDAAIHQHKCFADDVLDAIEENYSDQKLLMSAVSMARTVLNIPDDIGGDKD